MARNDTPDHEMERRLMEHFSEEARELRAPDDLWDRLEGRLGPQQEPRFAFLRRGLPGGLPALGGTAWVPAAAAALAALAVGIGIWALAAGGGGPEAPLPAAPATETPAPATPVVATATPTETATTTPATPTPTPSTATLTATPARATATPSPTAAHGTPTQTPTPVRSTPTPTPAATPTAEPTATGTPSPEPAATPVPTAEPPPADEADATAEKDAAGADAADAPGEPGEPAAPAADEAADGMADGDGMADDSMSDSGGRGGDAAAAPPAEEPAPIQPQRPPATTFEDYGRTPFTDTSTDAVSTFSLDTDRTSYFLALTWAQNGYAVEPDSVRAEEWINSFDYGYAPPGDEDSFAITSDVTMHPLDGDRHLARVAFQAPRVADDTPLNVTLVLDASGSMGYGNRVAIAREAAETIRQSLGARDRIAVVHFTDYVIDAYTVEHSASDDADVVQSIRSLAPHGSTNVQAGLNLGVQLADAARRERPEAFNYVILMSDGVANVDATDPFAILESAADTDSGNPLRLITIGVGIENYNDVLLEQLAQHGNGWYRYLDNTTQARETFGRQNWLALSSPFADQTRAQVTWDPAVVRAWRIVGYENRITPDHTFEQDRKEFAELPSGAATTVFYELVLHEGARAGSATLGSVELRWVAPASGASRSQSAAVSGNAAASFAGSDRYLRLGAIVGLVADRYSALSPQVENARVDYDGIHADLVTLGAELDALAGELGSLQAYTDFRFLLEHLTAVEAEWAPTSGYSR